MQFFPDESENTLLQQCVEGSVGLTNLAFQKLSLETRRQLSALVFHGATIVVAIQMTPHPSVVCTVAAHGESLELFRIETPPETQTETTH